MSVISDDRNTGMHYNNKIDTDVQAHIRTYIMLEDKNKSFLLTVHSILLCKL